jgi:hypothetical protein
LALHFRFLFKKRRKEKPTGFFSLTVKVSELVKICHILAVEKHCIRIYVYTNWL